MSIKKVEDKHQWAMLHKPKHDLAGVDPFTLAKQEKNAALEKQKLAELKNKINAAGAGKKNKDVKVLGAGAPKTDSLKLKDEGERNQIRKREQKALMKSLKLAQISTASMGKFDRRLKNEPDAPDSQKLKKKKSNQHLDSLGRNSADEKARNMKIFDTLQRKSEIDATQGKLQASKSKANAYIDDEKVARKAKKKDDIKRKKIFSKKE